MPNYKAMAILQIRKIIAENKQMSIEDLILLVSLKENLRKEKIASYLKDLLRFPKEYNIYIDNNTGVVSYVVPQNRTG